MPKRFYFHYDFFRAEWAVIDLRRTKRSLTQISADGSEEEGEEDSNVSSDILLIVTHIIAATDYANRLLWLSSF